jgi:hypothetical protein
MNRAAWLLAMVLAGTGCATDEEGDGSTSGTGTGTITQASCIRDTATSFKLNATFDARLDPGNLFLFTVVLPGDTTGPDGATTSIDCAGWSEAPDGLSCMRPQNSPERQALHATYARSFDIAVLNGGDAMYVDLEVLSPISNIDVEHVSCPR